MARALTPMEILMEEIRAPPTLRRVQNSYTTVSDSEIIKKKKLIPSIDLVADFTEEVSDKKHLIESILFLVANSLMSSISY